MAARVSGLITAAPFIEGSIVKKGDLLFVIDDRPFKADLDAKLAAQQQAEAQQAIAKVTYDRLLGLQKDRAVSQQDIDNAKANIDQADAAVAGAKAAVESSRLNLEWCRVMSPIDGRISNKLVTVGNLVNGGQGQATMLTTIESVTPMYCYVDIDEHSVLKYQELAIEKKLLHPRDGKVPCYVQLSNESGFPHEGYIDFVDNHVDPTTGTLRERGILQNKSGLLTPGLFARLCIPGSGRYRGVAGSGYSNRQRPESAVRARGEQGECCRAAGGATGCAVWRVAIDRLRVESGGLGHHQRADARAPGATVMPTEQTIQVDSAAFSDPGSTEMRDDSDDRSKSAGRDRQFEFGPIAVH